MIVEYFMSSKNLLKCLSTNITIKINTNYLAAHVSHRWTELNVTQSKYLAFIY